MRSPPGNTEGGSQPQGSQAADQDQPPAAGSAASGRGPGGGTASSGTTGAGSSPGVGRKKRIRSDRRVPHRDWTRYPSAKERPAVMGLRPSRPPAAPEAEPAPVTEPQPAVEPQPVLIAEPGPAAEFEPAPVTEPRPAADQKQTLAYPAGLPGLLASAQQRAQPAGGLPVQAPSPLPPQDSAALTEEQDEPPRSLSPVGRVKIVSKPRMKASKTPTIPMAAQTDSLLNKTLPSYRALPMDLAAELTGDETLRSARPAGLSNQTLRSSRSAIEETLRSLGEPEEPAGDTHAAVDEVLRRAALRQRARRNKATDPKELAPQQGPLDQQALLEQRALLRRREALRAQHAPRDQESPRQRRNSDPLAVTTPMVQVEVARALELKLEELNRAAPETEVPAALNQGTFASLELDAEPAAQQQADAAELLDEPEPVTSPLGRAAAEDDEEPPPARRGMHIQDAQRLSTPAGSTSATTTLVAGSATTPATTTLIAAPAGSTPATTTLVAGSATTPATTTLIAGPATKTLIAGPATEDTPGEHAAVDASAHKKPPTASADQSGAFTEVSPFLADRAFPGLPRAPKATAKAAPRPTVKIIRLNRWLFRGTIFGPFIGASVAGFVAARLADPSPAVAVMVALLVMSFAAQLIFIYRMWGSIQDSYAPVSPAKASLLMLIPLFNIYWIFRVLPGFATAYNDFTTRYLLRVPRLSQNLLLAALVVPIAGPVFYWIAIGRICQAVNAIPTGPRAPASIRADRIPGT